MLTSRDAVADARDRFGAPGRGDRRSGTDPDRVDPAPCSTILAGRGLRRVLTEGGPRCSALFIDDGLLDELCLTIAPTGRAAAGRRGSPTGTGEAASPGCNAATCSTDDEGYLYTRYVAAS